MTRTFIISINNLNTIEKLQNKYFTFYIKHLNNRLSKNLFLSQLKNEIKYKLMILQNTVISLYVENIKIYENKISGNNRFEMINFDDCREKLKNNYYVYFDNENIKYNNKENIVEISFLPKKLIEKIIGFCKEDNLFLQRNREKEKEEKDIYLEIEFEIASIDNEEIYTIVKELQNI